jgi:Fic family protein
VNPPFEITPEILNLCAEISRLLGQYEGLKHPIPQPTLRRKNRIKTIQGSLSIEGNTLTVEQITDILSGRRVVGPSKDILEAKNAILAYENIYQYDPLRLSSFLKAHKMLMQGLIEDAGHLRTKNVGILKGHQISHIAPKPDRVRGLMDDLFGFLQKSRNLHALIRSSVFHYEVEFIHPFADGNGRMGRLWQSAILVREHPIFEFTPTESIIKLRQKEYYRALERSDKAGKSTHFIIFMLQAVQEALEEFLAEVKPEPQTAESRLILAKEKFGTEIFSRKDYIQFLKTISTATASRDLSVGVKGKALSKTGNQALTQYRFLK